VHNACRRTARVGFICFDEGGTRISRRQRRRRQLRRRAGCNSRRAVYVLTRSYAYKLLYHGERYKSQVKNRLDKGPGVASVPGKNRGTKERARDDIASDNGSALSSYVLLVSEINHPSLVVNRWRHSFIPFVLCLATLRRHERIFPFFGVFMAISFARGTSQSVKGLHNEVFGFRVSQPRWFSSFIRCNKLYSFIKRTGLSVRKMYFVSHTFYLRTNAVAAK